MTAGTTISHVRGCAPGSMAKMASELITQNNTFSTRVAQMNSDVDAAMNGWRGDAAAAAQARSVAHTLAANHLGETVVTIAGDLNTYGAELDGVRTALLNIVDNELPFAGMTVDDQGNVTAPKAPTDNSTKPVVVILLQQALEGQASSFQTRIKNLLVQFGDGEVKAAQAITSALQTLVGYEKNPAAVPLVRPDVQKILDGNAQLPTDPAQLHNFWQTLTPAEKDALWQHDQYLGNRDGIPVTDRDHFNRLKLQDELTRAQAGDPTVKDRLGDLQTIAQEVGKPDRYLMLLDTQSGKIPHAAIAAGNPDTASNVSTYVPGTGSRPAKMGEDMKRVNAMRDQAVQSGAKNPSVVAWFGYDAPQDILSEATQRSYADAAAPALDRFQEGLRATHEGQPSYNTVIGHSYGTTLVGDAASHGRTLNADSVVLVASPGATVDHASDLSLTGVPHDEVAKHVFATKADNDPVPEYANQRAGQIEAGIEHRVTAGVVNKVIPGMGELVATLTDGNKHLVDDYGVDPTDSKFGAQVFESDPGSSSMVGYNTAAHSQYWDPNCKSLQGMGDIIAGRGNEAVRIK